ncbi:MAG: DNA adenine methylase, partial [Verrucomicrobiaceae bacterium]
MGLEKWREAESDIKEVLRGFENSESFYYDLRGREYSNNVEKAAKFIFLNQTSFNGIYRVNLKGEYNVPYGFRNKEFLEEELLKRVHSQLQGVNLAVADFDVVRKNLKEGDFVFLDPPYTVSHNHNGFIKYNEKLFSLDDQYRL